MEEQCEVFCLLSCTFCVLAEMHSRFCVCLCNENQLDALFILSLFCQATSTRFGHICSPSSGGILFIYNNLCVLCFSVVWLLTGRPVVFSLHGCIEMHVQQTIKVFVDGTWIYFTLGDVTCQTTVFLVVNPEGLIFHKQRVSNEVRTWCLYITYVDLKH